MSPRSTGAFMLQKKQGWDHVKKVAGYIYNFCNKILWGFHRVIGTYGV